MKIRTNFVSNSSSTSFVLDVSKLSEETKNKIDKLTDRSYDLSRSTGQITKIKDWLRMFDTGYEPTGAVEIKKLLKKHKELIIIRESDEEMGGSFENIDLDTKDFEDSVLLEFEYH